MKFCGKCGAGLEDDAAFCVSCGQSQTKSNVVNRTQQNTMGNSMNQQNGYQQNGYQQNGYQQNGYQQGGYQQSGYQGGMNQRKKIDVKGLIISILGLIVALITTFSVLMPIASGGKKGATIINITKNAKDLFKAVDDIDTFAEFLAFIYVVITVLAPYLVLVTGIVISIIFIVKLAKLNFSNKEVSLVRAILKVEVFISLFCVGYIYAAEVDIEDKMLMSVGWFLPVIICICIMVVDSIMTMVTNLAKKTNNYKCLDSICAILVMISSLLMYIGMGLSQIQVVDSYEKVHINVSYNLLMLFQRICSKWLWKGKALSFSIWIVISMIAVVVITIMASVCISKCIKTLKNGKFSGVISIVTGALAIVLYLVEFIMGSIVWEKYMDAKIKFGVSGYYYIIFGAIMIVIGIVYQVVSNYRRNYISNGIQYQNGMQYQNGVQYPNNVNNNSFGGQ